MGKYTVSNNLDLDLDLDPHYEGLDGVTWQLTNSLKFNWQLTFALEFTDNWQRTWLSLIFYKTRFKAWNRIVPLFSSDNVN